MVWSHFLAVVAYLRCLIVDARVSLSLCTTVLLLRPCQLGQHSVQGTDGDDDDDDGSHGFFSKLPLVQRRVLGVIMALISGCLYGTNFDPPYV